MKKIWTNTAQNESVIPPHAQVVPANKIIKSIYHDLAAATQDISALKQQSVDISSQLDGKTREYNQSQRAYVNLLKTVGEALQNCEIAIQALKSANDAVQGLNDCLKKEGVKRLYHKAGDPIWPGKCVVIGDLITNKVPEGCIAKVVSQGLYLPDGTVIVPSLIYRSIGSIVPLRLRLLMNIKAKLKKQSMPSLEEDESLRG